MPSRFSDLAQGLELVHRLNGPIDDISRYSWSPTGRYLAAGSWDHRVYVWDIASGALAHTLVDHAAGVTSIRWLTTDDQLLSASDDGTAIVWNVHDEKPRLLLHGDGSAITSVDLVATSGVCVGVTTSGMAYCWDLFHGALIAESLIHSAHITAVRCRPFSEMVATSSDDGTVRLWAADRPAVGTVLGAVETKLTSVTWAPNGLVLAASGWDGLIRIWAVETGTLTHVLADHAGIVDTVEFSPDGKFLVSRAESGTVLIQAVGSWNVVAQLVDSRTSRYSGPSVSPDSFLVATPGGQFEQPRVWRLRDAFHSAVEEARVGVSHARVIVLGCSRAGKTCLARALAGHPFEEQPSTHGIIVSRVKINVTSGVERELHVWDLAGQPEYRLVHSLFTDEAALALLVFDATDHRASLFDVAQWEDLLGSRSACPRILVSAQCDRLSEAELDQLTRTLSLDAKRFCLTSSRTGMGIRSLIDLMCQEIDWNKIPVNSSPMTLAIFRDLVFELRERGAVIVTESSLQDMFSSRLERSGAPASAEFSIILSGARAQGLAWRLRFGSLVLLSPDILDGYVSAIIRNARADPSGLGLIEERSVIDGALDWGDMHRLDREHERLLLYAAIELCIEREIALREDGRLLFPSVCSAVPTSWEERPMGVLSYSYPVDSIGDFVRLVVRLSYSQAFDLEKAYAAYATFSTIDGQRIDIELVPPSNEECRKILIRTASDAFELFNLLCRCVERHIKRSWAGEVVRRWWAECPNCKTLVRNGAAMEERLRRERDWIWCQYCDDQKVPLPLAFYCAASAGKMSKESSDLDIQVDRRKSAEARISVVEAKELIGEFDVFMCYNSTDRLVVEGLARQLRERGLRPWLDVWETRPGLPWQVTLQEQLLQVKAAAIIIGADGRGPWQDQEISAIIRQFVRRQCPAIPVLLADLVGPPKLPLFLEAMHYVDMRDGEKALDLLVWGITGRAPKWTQ